MAHINERAHVRRGRAYARTNAHTHTATKGKEESNKENKEENALPFFTPYTPLYSTVLLYLDTQGLELLAVLRKGHGGLVCQLGDVRQVEMSEVGAAWR